VFASLRNVAAASLLPKNAFDIGVAAAIVAGSIP
jgi:hypothetical protein